MLIDNYKQRLLKLLLKIFLTTGVIICTGSMILSSTIDFSVKVMAGFIFMGSVVLLGVILVNKDN